MVCNQGLANLNYLEASSLEEIALENCPVITLDDDYTKLGILLRRECQKRSIPFEQKDLNTQGFGDGPMGDLAYSSPEGLWSWEIKGSAESLNLDHLEVQLQKQAENCHRLGLMIYGPPVEPAVDGNCYAYGWTTEKVTWDRHPDSGGQRGFSRRYYHSNYQGYIKKLARFQSEFGVIIIERPSLEALSLEIISQYEVANSLGEGRTFSRYVPEKIRVREEDAAKKAFMLTLMGIQGAGIGEEVADAIASEYRSIRDLCSGFDAEDNGSIGSISAHLATIPLRSGKRTIGPAAVQKLKSALGI